MNKFCKTRRLLNKHDFDEVFSRSDKLATSEFIVLYRKNTLGYARLGLAISKKRVAKAHERNRLKRLLRETFRTSALSAIDVVVLAKEGAAKAPNAATILNLRKMWEKLSA